MKSKTLTRADLAEALVNKGLNLDSVNVGVGDKSRQAQQQSQGQSQRQHGHASQAGSSQREVTDHSRSLRTNGNVDIWI